MRRLSFLSLIALLIASFTSPVFAATAYYVDCSAPTNGDGTYSSPWNNIASVNSHYFSTGDDVYLKEGTTCYPTTEGLQIDWDGAEGDRIVIGCYDGNGDFDCSDGGLTRPILDGQSNVYPTNLKGMILMNSSSLSGHITITDIRVNESSESAFVTNYVDDVIITNTYSYRPKKSGILVARCAGGTVSNNIVEESSYLHSPRAGIEISAVDSGDSTHDIIVTGNTVFKGLEGIGVYNGAKEITVEKNVVYDCRVVGIYIEGVKDITVRHNVVYQSATGPPNDPDGMMYAGIYVTHENRHCTQGGIYPYGNDGHRIYGNLVAGAQNNINLSNSPDCHQMTNVLVYNNTLVDAQDWNIRLNNVNDNWSGNEIKNNISWTISEGSGHVRTGFESATGVTWSHNNFDEPVSGNAATNAKIYRPLLEKTTDWRSIVPGSVDGTEWSLEAGSQNKDNGLSIDGHNDRIYNADFNSSPITVNTSIDSTPDIGAWMIKGNEESLLAPQNLAIIQIN